MTTLTSFDANKADLNAWLEYLENIHTKEIDLGLARISEVASRMACHLNGVKVITVAGTNGKGTTCAFLENALLSKGFKVAVYSSPHIHRFNERLRINKQEIDDNSLIQAFKQIEQARQEISLTYYEYTTLAAFLILQKLAAQSQLDYAILEVGLGGRLDATNMIDADIGVITSIDLDHQAFLGDTRELIGIEKAGILREKQIAVIGEPNLPKNVKAHIDYLGCDSYFRDESFTVEITSGSWHYLGEQKVEALPMPNIPVDNVATAYTVLKKLNLDFNRESLIDLIAKTQVPGRTQRIATSPDVVCDVAHNPHAATYLAKFVENYRSAQHGQKPEKVHAVVGMLSDKDIESTLKVMQEVIDQWYVATLDVPRGADAQVLSGCLINQGAEPSCVNAFDNIKQAFTIATQNAKQNELVIVFGSFFTVAEIPGVL